MYSCNIIHFRIFGGRTIKSLHTAAFAFLWPLTASRPGAAALVDGLLRFCMEAQLVHHAAKGVGLDVDVDVVVALLVVTVTLVLVLLVVYE